jgi:hypothetical protein
MKLTPPKNIFEAQALGTFLSKIVGLNFITIKKNEFGKFSGSTEILDFLIFFTWLIFSFCLALDSWRNPFDPNSNRSFIFEIMVAMTGKSEAFRACVELFQIFLNRHKYLKILDNIHWIDEKVYLQKNQLFNLILHFVSIVMIFCYFFAFGS